ncbi:MAG: hypothetical protein V1789_07665 [PVC group bacterium]
MKLPDRKTGYSYHRGPGRSPGRRQENPAFSSRLGRYRFSVRLWGSNRVWYSYHGYARMIRYRVYPSALLPFPPSPVRLLKVIPGLIFLLLPLLLYPVYFRLAELIYPRLLLLGKAVRPPAPASFFQEMYILVLAAAAVIIVQTLFALIFIRRPKTSVPAGRIPWGEASVVGALLSLGVYGVLRGFQISPADRLFLPASALGAAVLCWLLISGTILFRVLKSPE